MKPWRSCGFVQDSEDEDELSVQSQTSSRVEKLLRPTRRASFDAEPTVDAIERRDRSSATSLQKETAKEFEIIAQDQRKRVAKHNGLADGLMLENELAFNCDPPRDDLNGFTRDNGAVRQHILAGGINDFQLSSPAPVQAKELRRDERITLANDVNARVLEDLPSSLPFSPNRISSPILAATSTCSQNLEPIDCVEGELHTAWAPRRNFRQRKAIQLHPYLILDGIYQQDMRAAGLVPTRLIHPSPVRQTNDQHGGRNSDSDRESQSTFQSPPPPHPRRRRQDNAREQDSAPAVCHVHRHQARSQSPAFESNLQDDDLPALGDLLSHTRSAERVYMGSKRRKILHSTRHLSLRRAATSIPGPAVGNDISVSNGAPVLGIPLSPASSASASPGLPSIVGRGGFRFPVGFSPQKPLTPVTSSSGNISRRRPVAKFREDSSPLPQLVRSLTVEPPPPVEISTDDDTASSESSAEPSLSLSENEDDSRQLKVIQKRIKGVLPASWLKLDVKAQVKGPNSRPGQRPQHEWPNASPQPGVAQRRFRVAPSSRSIRDTLAISSDEESEAETETLHRPDSDVQLVGTRSVHQPFTSFPVLDDDPGDNMEDNAVDFMLPSVSRGKRTKTGGERKRQTKLIEAFEHAAKQPRKGYQAHQANQARGRQKSRRHPKARSSANTQARLKPPRLGVLDAMSLSPVNSSYVPSFLKVAYRQAKRLPDQGRQTPVQKNLRLQTREDTTDVSLVLANWRAGRLKSQVEFGSEARSPTMRRPLAPKDTNVVHFLHPFATKITSRRDRLLQKGAPPVAHANPELTIPSEMSQPQPFRDAHGLPRRVSLRPVHRLHDGQLQGEEDTSHLTQDRMVFDRAVQRANWDYALSRRMALPTIPRTLAELEAQIQQRPSPEVPSPKVGHATPERVARPCPSRSQRGRKMRPRRIDVETRTYRQPEEFALPVYRRAPSPQIIQHAAETLQNLNPWGIPYAHDFDILPLPAGTYFHQRTFVGSGNFRKALAINNRSIDIERGTHIVMLTGQQYRWGPWNEELSSNIKSILTQVNADVTAAARLDPEGPRQQNGPPDYIENSIGAIEAILNANSNWLSFSDSVDRSALGRVYLSELEDLQSVFEECKIHSVQNRDRSQSQRLLCLATRLAVLAGQILAILRKDSTCCELQAQCKALLKRQASSIIAYLTCQGLDEIRAFYDDNQRHSVREAGIRGNQAAVEATVVLIRLLEESTISGLSFWDSVNAQILPSIETATQTGALEHGWLSAFTFLPLFEIDSAGLYQPGARFHSTPDNWEAVKKLVSRTFDLYNKTALLPGASVNEYVRALLRRCHHLIQAWAWRRCESIISVIFDFFAKREYRSLHNEDKYGSPQFMEQLACNPSLDALRDEKAFHTLLKIIATGLLGMQIIYSSKNIRSIVWRWIPNHSRTFDKDKDLRKEDLDALRNQHDLLSTLYWASPASLRPRLDLIQNLVDHSASHLEACRINIKSWSNLVAFQLSTNEPAQAANPFSDWLKDILDQNVSQYKLARPELVAQYEAAKQHTGSTISSERLETMISRNQNGIMAALGEALAGMRSAIKTANNLLVAWTFLRDSGLQTVSALFDSKKKKANSILLEVLSIFDAFLDLIDRQPPIANLEVANEESQDYGDWPDEDDLMPNKGPAEEALEFILEQAASLLSNVFGSESSPDDDLLMRVVQHWTRLVTLLVRRKMTDLETFVSDYGRHSWAQLRDTDQRRKYASYFLSCLLRADGLVVEHHGEQYFNTWMRSLVEREAHLKYQHVLTTDLLNAHPSHPLLKNLPFVAEPGSGRYNISFTELRERRLALLSSVLSNMHDELQRVLLHDPASVRALRSEYSSLLNHTMLQMRRNYEELRQGEVVTGTYVTFVQAMVELMQQYTTDICPVDRYFTDSAMFPLPTNDPTYLVGRLKSYDSKLADTKMIKQLIMFVQAVSERAAVDCEQGYLITQLTTALDGSFEYEHLSRPSLRLVLIQVVFPVYIEASFDGSPAWILARPLLSVCSLVFKNLIHKFSATKSTSVQAVNIMLMTILASLMKAVSPLEFAPHLLQQPHILSTLSLIFDVATVCIPSLDYIRRRNRLGAIAADSIQYLRDFTLFAGKVLLGRPDAFPPTNLGNDFNPNAKALSHMAFCSQRLQEDLREKWKMAGGSYQVKRGNGWKELQTSVASLDEERSVLIRRIEDFHDMLDKAKSMYTNDN